MKTALFILFSLLCIAGDTFYIKKELKVSVWQYIVVGVLNAVYIGVKIFNGHITAENFFAIFGINMLICLALSDIKEMELSVVYIAVFAAVGAMGSIVVLKFDFVYTIIFTVVVFAVLFLIARKSKEGIGMGDVFLIACTSLYGTPSTTMTVVIESLLFSLIFGIVFSLKSKTGIKTLIPYAPFLFVAFYLTKLI